MYYSNFLMLLFLFTNAEFSLHLKLLKLVILFIFKSEHYGIIEKNIYVSINTRIQEMWIQVKVL